MTYMQQGPDSVTSVLDEIESTWPVLVPRTPLPTDSREGAVAAGRSLPIYPCPRNEEEGAA